MEDAMKVAIEIVKAQASVRPMTSEEMSSMITTLASNINDIASGSVAATAEYSPAIDPTKCIRERSVICLECGKSFKVLTRKHIESHGMSVAEYREKHSIKKGVSLVCKSLQRERKVRMKEMQLWNRRKVKPGNTHAEVVAAKEAANEYKESAFPGREEIV